MSYNNMNAYPAPSGLGAPGAGFASRGKTHRPNRLSLASPPQIDSISENPIDGMSAPPRTSRSHLLAGLRTQPRTPGAVPASAPYNKTSHGHTGYGMISQQYQQQSNVGYGNVPHTAIGSNFPSMHSQQSLQAQHSQQLQRQHTSLTPGQQLYGLPEQVLAPPHLQIEEDDEHIDPALAAQLYATQIYLQERQMQLQQLAMAQQMQNMQLGAYNNHNKASHPQTPVTPQHLMYAAQQQVAQQQAIEDALVFQQVPGQPHLLLAYNQLTGDASYIANPLVAQSQTHTQAVPARNNNGSLSNDHTPVDEATNSFSSRSRSPAKRSSPPTVNVEPLPPPSANAFRRGHNRNRSSLAINSSSSASVENGPRSALVRPIGIPATPMTGTFAPGHGRLGEHASRQPIGPPPAEELGKAPIAKCEGSKNFATRQRRKALDTLVRAGLERRVVRPGSGGSNRSVSSTSPVSDTELTFSVPSDNESDSGRSLSGRLSIGSLRAAASGAIGSERISLRSRSKESLNSFEMSMERKETSTPVLVGLGASKEI